MIDEIKLGPVAGANHVRPGSEGKTSFADALKGFAAEVDRQLQDANRKTEEFAVGKRFDLHEIMVSTEKADLSLRLLMQIRNKLLDAYQEIMRMQF
jgi:flagellar hook-basal body complex protein FliE